MRGLAAHHLAADDALGVLDGDAALGAFDEDDEGDDRDHADDQDGNGDGGEGSPGAVAGLLVEVFDAAGQADDDAGEDEQAHTVADAALGDLLTQPHDEGSAGGEGDDAERNEGAARDGDHRLAGAGVGQRERDGEGLHDAEQDGDVAGPLGDLAAAEFAFLLELRERLIDDGEQLEDDRRRDVRHDAESEDGKLAEVSAGEEVDQAESGAGVRIEELGEHVGVDAGGGDVPAEAIDGQHAKREEDALAEVGDFEDVCDFLEHRVLEPRGETVGSW